MFESSHTGLMARHWLTYQRELLRLPIPGQPSERAQRYAVSPLIAANNSRRIGNWRELAFLAQPCGFELTIKPLGMSEMSEILSAIAVVRMLLAVSSTSYNAVFMPRSSAVLGIDAVSGAGVLGRHGWSPSLSAITFLKSFIGYLRMSSIGLRVS